MGTAYYMIKEEEDMHYDESLNHVYKNIIDNFFDTKFGKFVATETKKIREIVYHVVDTYACSTSKDNDERIKGFERATKKLRILHINTS